MLRLAQLSRLAPSLSRRSMHASAGSRCAATDAAAAAAAAASSTLPRFHIIDTTLREGEQFASTDFSRQDRIYIAKLLDQMGIEYIELVNPYASAQAAEDCRVISSLGLRAKVVAHVRCHMDDVKAAVATGLHGVSMYMATSAALRKHSHGKGIEAIIATAKEVISFVKEHGLEVRFSCEDTFRSDRTDLLAIYKAVEECGVHRVGLADTVGIAHPAQVAETVRAVREILRPETGIEFHAHNDTGCAIANALVAIQNGATHINTCVLGIGERNGITSLGGFLARLYTMDKNVIKSKYRLSILSHLERYVARAARVAVPFNNYVTGSCAFTHKAGVHSKAVMSDPGAYEVIDPADFGVERQIEIAHRLTGWNALRARARDLKLNISDDLIKATTKLVKNIADRRRITIEELDAVLMSLTSMGLPGDASSSKYEAMAAETEDPLRKKLYQGMAATFKQTEEQAAAVATAHLERTPEDMRQTAFIKISGHLFDKAILNKVLDLVVDSPADFEVTRLSVPQENSGLTTAVLQLWAEDISTLHKVRDDMKALIATYANTAQASLEEVQDEREVSGLPRVTATA